jgi:hypothetical protein
LSEMGPEFLQHKATYTQTKQWENPQTKSVYVGSHSPTTLPYLLGGNVLVSSFNLEPNQSECPYFRNTTHSIKGPLPAEGEEFLSLRDSLLGQSEVPGARKGANPTPWSNGRGCTWPRWISRMNGGRLHQSECAGLGRRPIGRGRRSRAGPTLPAFHPSILWLFHPPTLAAGV